jgi:hypothetical protein
MGRSLTYVAYNARFMVLWAIHGIMIEHTAAKLRAAAKLPPDQQFSMLAASAAYPPLAAQHKQSINA